MEKYAVSITDNALADMQEIYYYIAHALSAPETARGQYNRIAEAILTLDSFPERFQLFNAEPEHSLGIRKMVVDNYLVCYVVDTESVTVIAVFYGASDVHMRLKDRT